MLGHQLFRHQVEQLLNDFDTGLFDWNYERDILNDPFFLTEEIKPHTKRPRQLEQKHQQQQDEKTDECKVEKTDEKMAACKNERECKNDNCKSETCKTHNKNKNNNNNEEDTKMSVSCPLSFPLSLPLQLQTIKLDVVEKEKEYAINADMPGVNKEDVKLSVRDDILTICGERKEEQKTENKNFKRIERSRGILSRSIRLPRDVDQTKISASQENGVLTIILPKSEIAQQEQKIVIK